MSIFDIFTGKSAKDAAAQNTMRLNALKNEGMGYLDAGKTGALSELDAAAGVYDPLRAKYGAGTNLYLDALGVNGADGNSRATNSFQAGPGYQWNVDQATDAVARKANALGGIGGNALAAISDRAGQMANQEYGSWLDRLGGLIKPELAASFGVAGIDTTKAGVYTDDAAKRLGLASSVTGGINNQATQSANAEMAGSGNLWNLGLNIAKLGTGLLGGAAK